MTTQEQVAIAQKWYRHHRPTLQKRLQSPWKIGEVTYRDDATLDFIDAWLGLNSRQPLSQTMAEAYILRPLRQMKSALNSDPRNV